MKTPLLLEIVPALHGDLAGVEFTFAAVAAFVGTLLFTCGLSGVSPGEIVKVPECVDWEDEVPYRQREEVDQHPDNVADTVGSDDDENSGQTQNQCEEDKWDDWCGCVFDTCFDRNGN